VKIFSSGDGYDSAVPPETRSSHRRIVFAHRAASRLIVMLGVITVTKLAAARPESPCLVRLDEGPTSATWASASDELREHVAKLTATTTDCRLIVVKPLAQGASVEFTTSDQRIARRHIAAPADLLPLVEALLVFGHDPTAIAPPPPEARERLAMPGPAAEVAVGEEAPRAAAPQAPASPSPLADPPRDALEPPKKVDAPRVLMGAGAGIMKGGWPSDSVAAVGQVYAGMTKAHWELAGFGRWELEHDADADSSRASTHGRLRYSAVGGGAMVARRQPVGPLVLIGGARAALYLAEQERAGGPKVAGRSTHESEEFFDPRLGLYAACVVSESSRLRLRVQVDGDMGLVVHRAELADLGAFPRWNMGLSLGAEAGFLP